MAPLPVEKIPQSRASSPATFLRTHRISPEYFSTERVDEIDPDAWNPHRRRWLLRRQLEPEGLRAEKDAGGFRVRLDALRATAEEWFRGKGPWHRAAAEFPCGEEESWFATEAGSRVASGFAAEAWLKEADLRFPALLHSLGLLRGVSEAEALSLALLRIESWKRGLESAWREEILPRARAEEWGFYRSTHGGPECKRTVSAISWDGLREPMPSGAAAIGWKSIPAEKVKRRIVMKEDGSFLLDPGAYPHLRGGEGTGSEVISYSWAGGKGKARVDLPQAKKNDSSVGRGVWGVTSTTLSSALPDLISCCDGVIGREFVRTQIVEWDPSRKEIRVALPKGFAPPRGWLSTEAILDRDGFVTLPSCALTGPKGKQWWGGRFSPAGSGWLTLDSAYRREFTAPEARGSVDCGGGWNPFTGFPIQVGGGGSLAPRVGAAFELGSAVLSSRAWILDLPHGWVHFPPGSALDAGVKHPDFPVLRTEYRLVEGRRKLFVASAPGKTNAALKALRMGTEVVAIQGKSPETISITDVESILRGERGSEIVLRVREPGKKERKIQFVLE